MRCVHLVELLMHFENKSLEKLSLSLRLRINYSAFAFLAGSHDTIYNLAKMQKRTYPCISGFHGTIHTFKNYFTTVFSTISFQFLANK